ncbi:tyrosinase family protein [Frateuria sp. YIM B11624]|uniref:tyrosinase family protein n=1 Tax=Frateuria sp. YIM B11624 TaxID=3143185 RepID=UPI003C743DA5
MISRRRFLQSSLTVALLPMLPKLAVSADLRVRQSWPAFCTGPTYPSLLYAVQTMRANKTSTDPASWEYWAIVHRYNCPHGKPYFLSWHRGFLYRFEEMLRQVSGDPNLVLPYWNYYDQPTVPAEFLDSTSSLYRGDRQGTDVYGALSMDPFAPEITNFVRYTGATDAFEPQVEMHPHNPVHNLIGGVMAWIAYSPRDPLFWVHHANIDRLWVAWLNAGGGRHEPATTASYWDGDNFYGKAVDSMPRVWTRNTTVKLGYQYDDETMPAGLPADPSPSATNASVASTEAFSLGGTTARPAAVGNVALGASKPLDLDENSISVQVTLTPQDANRVRSAMIQPAAVQPAAADSTGPVRVVLDGVDVSGLGKKGGYFYKVFVNLPQQGVAAREERNFLVGMVGAFEISVAQMKASMKGMQGMDMQAMDHMSASGGAKARLVFPATEALKRAWPDNLDQITVSFVRVDGRKRPTKGRVIHIDAFRLEADPAK